MGNAKSVKLFFLILFGLTGVVHGATGIYLRTVFEKSANGILNQDKEVHFGVELNNRQRIQLKLKWYVR